MQGNHGNGQEESDSVETCTPQRKKEEIEEIALIQIFRFWPKICFLTITCQPYTLDGQLSCKFLPSFLLIKKQKISL